MLSRLYHTLKYLKAKQIVFQIYYRLKNRLFSPKYKIGLNNCGRTLILKPFLPKQISYKSNSFKFLNRIKEFKTISEIEWDFDVYGKLWTYNLNYMDYLLQDTMTEPQAEEIINSFVFSLPKLKNAIEPYPISLRGINWIKYITANTCNDEIKRKIDNSLFAQYKILYKNIEYHLLGNHLLENGISLMYGALYFENKKWYKKARKILISELHEQILNDGGHFELSPMYHQIILDRLLDAYNLLESNFVFENQSGLKNLIKIKSKIMLGWINQVCFSSGKIPLFNDAAFTIAPCVEELNRYAERLNIEIKKEKLSTSGIRSFNLENYELRYDAGNIGPDYIPGHAHSDTFTFELYLKGTPIIVDTGTSTYQKGIRRQLERETEAHNTVKFHDKEQSEVWGGHKVGRRAHVQILQENDNHIAAIHHGYSKWKVVHKRELSCEANTIIIEDFLSGNQSNGTAFLHFHPNQNVRLVNNKINLENIIIEIEGSNEIELGNYEYASEFNNITQGVFGKITFVSNLLTKIKIKEQYYINE